MVERRVARMQRLRTRERERLGLPRREFERGGLADDHALAVLLLDRLVDREHAHVGEDRLAAMNLDAGRPRDLDEVHSLGFQLFGLNPCVSHAYVRLVDFGKPVKLAGVEIVPGELIHADKHGVCLIPREIAPRLAEACAEVERMEKPLLEICRSDDFSLEEYLARRTAMKSKIRE